MSDPIDQPETAEPNDGPAVPPDLPEAIRRTASDEGDPVPAVTQQRSPRKRFWARRLLGL